MAVVQIFKALGDPVRLEIVRRLSDGSSPTIGHLSQDLGMTRQGARKQIEVLVSANVVRLTPNGRETHVSLQQQALEQARAFISELENQWDQRLAALKALAERNS